VLEYASRTLTAAQATTAKQPGTAPLCLPVYTGTAHATTPASAVRVTNAGMVSASRRAGLPAPHAQPTQTAAQDTHAMAAIAAAPIPARPPQEDAALMTTAAQATTARTTTAPCASPQETAQQMRRAAAAPATQMATAHPANAAHQMKHACKTRTAAMGLPARRESAHDVNQ